MDVASVGASGAYANTSIQSTGPQAAQEALRAERSQQPPAEQPAQTEPARPVANAQGQMTGTLINVTA